MINMLSIQAPTVFELLGKIRRPNIPFSGHDLNTGQNDLDFKTLIEIWTKNAHLSHISKPCVQYLNGMCLIVYYKQFKIWN